MTLTVTSIRFIAGALALISWLSLLLQWTLMYGRLGHSTGHILARFFGYFTILSNTLAAIAFSLWFVWPVRSIDTAALATVCTAICVYIIIVAVIYHAVLRKTVLLQGLDRLVNVMLHSWLPAAYILCWQFLLPKGLLSAAVIPYILIFPVLYLLYALLFGHITEHYPYPFINVLEAGYPKVIRNACCIALCFVLVSWLLIYWKS